jgi:hypothetical protein
MNFSDRMDNDVLFFFFAYNFSHMDGYWFARERFAGINGCLDKKLRH